MNEPDFQKQELIPAIVQDVNTREVRMLGYMSRGAYQNTRKSRELYFYSRSRNAQWRKGETSGNVHRVVGMKLDCDGDAILVLVDPRGPTCHTGNDTCFFQPLLGAEETKSPPASNPLERLEKTIASRREKMPAGSYTAKLFAEGRAKIARKVGEEAVETVIAGLNGTHAELVAESADLLYHLMVLWADRQVGLAEVLDELERRMK